MFTLLKNKDSIFFFYEIKPDNLAEEFLILNFILVINFNFILVALKN